MVQIVVNVSVNDDRYVIQASLHDNGREVYTCCMMQCPDECERRSLVDPCFTCPYENHDREEALLDEYEPKMVDAIRRVAEIMNIPVGSDVTVTRQDE